MSSPPPTPIHVIPLQQPPPPEIISQIVTLHQLSVSHDGALMRFHPPWTTQKTAQMYAWWTTRLSDAGKETHHVFLALRPPENPFLVQGAAEEAGMQEGGVGVVGICELCVCLPFPILFPIPLSPLSAYVTANTEDRLTPISDTAPFRAEIEMLMVHPAHRGAKIASRLVDAVETRALEAGKTMLTLATTRGSDAERYLYPRRGYVVFGVLRGYGIAPPGVGEEGEKGTEGEEGGKKGRVDGVYMFKELEGN
jgi:GNAT superfamily N-acetyltransferase